MDKKTALEFIVAQAKSVTAKQVSIDLDAPISTTTELLERMSAQGLLTRDRDQRPREYSVTEEGRKRLEFFRSRDGDRPAPGDAHAEAGPGRNPNVKPGTSASGVAPLPIRVESLVLNQKLDALRDELYSRLDALREDSRDLLEVLAANPSSVPSSAAEDQLLGIESVESLAKVLQKRLEGLEARKAIHAKVLEFYAVCCDWDNAPRFSFGNPARKSKVVELEKEIPPEVVERVKRLRALEEKMNSQLTPDGDRPQLAEEIRPLRAKLGLPPVGKNPEASASETDKRDGLIFRF